MCTKNTLLFFSLFLGHLKNRSMSKHLQSLADYRFLHFYRWDYNFGLGKSEKKLKHSRFFFFDCFSNERERERERRCLEKKLFKNIYTSLNSDGPYSVPGVRYDRRNTPVKKYCEAPEVDRPTSDPLKRLCTLQKKKKKKIFPARFLPPPFPRSPWLASKKKYI